MPHFQRSDEGLWGVADVGDGTPEGYAEQATKILNSLEKLFSYAKDKCEFELIWTLLGIRGAQDAGWDPFETSVNAISEVMEVSNKSANHVAQQHLQLWLYLHIMEASEPYEILANVLTIINGGRFLPQHFPDPPKGAPISPGAKIAKIKELAATVNFQEEVTFLDEIWDRTLRNSIGHAEYSLYPGEVRTFRPLASRPQQKVAKIVNGAIAYFFALQTIHSQYVSSYDVPKTILTHPDSSSSGSKPAIVMVREGHGAIGLKDAWTEQEIQNGAVRLLAARLNADEQQLIRQDPSTAFFPATAAAS